VGWDYTYLIDPLRRQPSCHWSLFALPSQSNPICPAANAPWRQCSSKIRWLAVRRPGGQSSDESAAVDMERRGLEYCLESIAVVRSQTGQDLRHAQRRGMATDL
jgi:hypothetical protein